MKNKKKDIEVDTAGTAANDDSRSQLCYHCSSILSGNRYCLSPAPEIARGWVSHGVPLPPWP